MRESKGVSKPGGEMKVSPTEAGRSLAVRPRAAGPGSSRMALPVMPACGTCGARKGCP